MKVLTIITVIVFIETSKAYRYDYRKHEYRTNAKQKTNIYDNGQRMQEVYDVVKKYHEDDDGVEGDDSMEVLYNKPEAEMKSGSEATIEVDALHCPQGCVCQYAHFSDLPISHWINFMQQKASSSATGNAAPDDDLINDNESNYEGDLSYLINPFVKQSTCIIQEDTDTEKLIGTLPHDIQALVLLYTGIGRNKTVNTNILKALNQLQTLEVRGSQDRGLRLVLDAPLHFLKHANFESITLMGSEVVKRPNNFVHPKEVFKYKPNIELLNSMEFTEEDINTKHYDRKLLVELQQQEQEELEIVPYEVYIEEVKKAKMPTFYGWERLEVLRIQACGMQELSWEMFMGLDELQHLSLEQNNIEVVPPFALSGATQLKTLSLAHNAIHDLHYRNLAGLFELQVLDLSDNRLTKLTELSFPPLPKLEQVDFRNNPIRYIFPASFWVMNNTREMYFGSNETPLELWGNQPFKKLTQLRQLEINNVSINYLEQNIFKDLISLQKLKLRGEINSLEFDAFSGCSELSELDLSHCQINDISMDAFMGCKSLRMINLSHNNITYITPGLFDDQPNLEEIYLNNNHLKTLPKTFFQQRKLMVARLSENPWKCSCDMANWKAKITNQENVPPTERCINDYFSGKKLSCRKFSNYKFNKQFAPRCQNFNGRTVFYVLRKQMQCGTQYLQLKNRVSSSNHRLPHWRKMEARLRTSKNNLTEQPYDEGSNPLSNRMLWQLQKQEKVQATLRNLHENSLDYQFAKVSHAKRTEHAATDVQNEI
ncbi:toll-like receptor 13 [Stomoxys calcitrans]|uniref:toll-like receptor 13 n=1 Tax=Stomoxys calcitrans TaxID=35570 RepID=UPI0027E31855|nr:toll-like receptor 13 [Stomoxys calcitrans]